MAVIMTQSEKYKIISEDYYDLILRYNGNPASLDKYKEYSVQIMNEFFAVIYVPVGQVTEGSFASFGFSTVPHCYALTSEQSLDASGVIKLRRAPAFNLRGKGVIIGIIDTGIEYTNPVFRNRDGSTKIISIWDQTIDSEDRYPEVRFPAYYGTEYKVEQINEALKTENPLQLVPTNDENGHGTMLAGIAGGSEDAANEFSGVAPDADFIIVKLKPAKNLIKNYTVIPPAALCYQENDIIWGLQYIVDTARSLERPLAMCICLGTAQGGHDNSGALNTEVSIVGDFPGIALTVSAGNEGNARRHFYHSLNPTEPPIAVELNVGENEYGFSMEFWGTPPLIYTFDILSPSGEYIPKLNESLTVNREIGFFFERTTINLDYNMVEAETGKQEVILRFRNPSAGIWKFMVYGRGDLQGEFHLWLPSDEFITKDTYFINSNPYTTITSPGNSIVPITVTAYNSNTDTLYANAGRGFSASRIFNPDFAAPGVNLQCPDLKHGFTTMTGTGAAAAHTAGITALLLEWSIVNGNYPGWDTVGMKKFLIRGARRRSNLTYPNRDWGYGVLDIYESFDILRSEVVRS